jgi:CheY-like chemotaxis protein
MPSGGELLIETGNLRLGDPAMAAELGLAEGDYVRLSVSDTGHGIEPEHLARVFEPFFTTKEAGRGTGLGLSVIYGFATQSGGRVTIQSQPGEGTAVTLYLPRAAAESTGPARRGGASPASTASGEVILVVEDQEPVREVTIKRLARLGYQTREAESAVAAIELLRSGAKVDLIFSDVVMPGGLTGFDLAEWAAINHPGLAVLLTSGFSESIAQGLTGERGAVAVLRKPYSGEDLAAAIRAALDQARLTSGVKT